MPRAKRTLSGVLGGAVGVLGLSVLSGGLVAATTLPMLAVATTTADTAINVFVDLPSALKIDELMMPTVIYVKNAEGKDVEMTRFYEQNRSPVSYEQIAPVMIDAITSSEDGHFFEHGGVDLIGTTVAVLRNATGGGDVAGGSSISQQYVKNVLVQQCEATAKTAEDAEACYLEATTSTGKEGIARKLQEMRLAIALEQNYSKETILTGYLNIANFGGTTYGVDAAAKYYFGTSAAKLNLDQAAALAGMLQDPNRFALDVPESESNGAANGYAATKDRQKTVLYNMHKDGKITDAEFDAALEAPIVPKITNTTMGCAAATGMEYFCQIVKGVLTADPATGLVDEEKLLQLNRGGLKVYTTLDTVLQASANSTMHSIVPTTLGYGTVGSAAVSVEAETGRLLSIVQNTQYSELEADAGKPGVTSLVYGADQRFGRSMASGFEAGSTFKLFTLLEWLNKGNSINQVLDGRNRPNFKLTCNGSPVNTGAEIQAIGNAGGVPGEIGTPTYFTQWSRNTGFFAMAEHIDTCEVGKVASKMGVVTGNDLEPVATSGAFSLLGSANISPLAMAGAYATVANKGKYCEPKVIDRVTDSKGNDRADLVPKTKCTQAVTPEVAATAIVSLSAVTNGGSGAEANPWDNSPVFGKTGTHENKQTWMVVSSSKVTTAVWAGNAVDEEIDVLNDYVEATGYGFPYMRYDLAREIQRAADARYPGDAFPEPDANLTRKVAVDVPDVLGLTIEAATKKITDAGLTVTVGPEVQSDRAKGLIEAQTPKAGKSDSVANVVISPSNGKPKPKPTPKPTPTPDTPKQVEIPSVAGDTVTIATQRLEAAGFSDIVFECQANDAATDTGIVLSTDPGAGSRIRVDARVTVKYEQNHCA